MSCDPKPRKPNQVLIGRHASGEAVVFTLPESIAEAEARIVLETRIFESCELTAKIQEKKLASGMLTQEAYDEWQSRWRFVHTHAKMRAAALNAWADAAIAASENDAVAVEQTNRIALLEARVAELQKALNDSKAQRVTEGLREMTRRARENQEQAAAE